jgi:hypothetical protein
MVTAILLRNDVTRRPRRRRGVRRGRSVPRRSTRVAGSFEALIYTQGINELYRLQVIAHQDDEDFNVAYIGEQFSFPHRHLFAADYLRHLFGYAGSLCSLCSPRRQPLITWHCAGDSLRSNRQHEHTESN